MQSNEKIVEVIIVSKKLFRREAVVFAKRLSNLFQPYIIEAGKVNKGRGKVLQQFYIVRLASPHERGTRIIERKKLLATPNGL
jgi:hypothetical protein